MINNNKGSVLVITVGLVVIFLLFGLAAIKYAGVQNADAELREQSIEALWLADGAVKMAYSKFVADPSSKIPKSVAAVVSNDSDVLDRWTYDVVLSGEACTPACFDPATGAKIPCPCMATNSCLCDIGHVQAYGLAENQSRAILARISAYLGGYKFEAIQSTDTVNDDCEPDGNAIIDGGCEQNSDFTFKKVFDKDGDKGWDTIDDFITDMDTQGLLHTYINPANNDPAVVIKEVTLIIMDGNNNSLSITSTQQEYESDGVTPKASFLIIDTMDVDLKNISLNFNGNGIFYGVIWILGDAVEIKGTADIYGSVFVDGAENELVDDTKVSGTSNIIYDTGAIEDAIDVFDPNYVVEEGEPQLGDLVIKSWQEIPVDTADYEL